MIEHPREISQPPGVTEPAAPRDVRVAGWIMYAGGAVSVIRVVVTLVTTGATKAAIHAKHPGMSASTLSTTTGITVIATAVLSLIGALLFIWIARACLRGKNAARVTATVLAALGVLLLIYDVSAGRGTADLAVSYVVEALGLASVTFLWLPSSGTYFRYFKRPQL
jgi:hypothetical protein